MDARVQDYVDDKLQSTADLETLDSLLENVKAQHELLKQQLKVVKQGQQRAQELKASVLENAHSFLQEQDHFEQELLTVTQSDTVDDVARKYEPLVKRLQKIQMADGYVTLLLKVDALKSECMSRLEEGADAALRPYKQLQQLLANLTLLHEAAEGAAQHLLDHVAQNIHDLRQPLQAAFSQNLEQTMKKINWPKSTDRIPLALEQEWNTNFGALLDLQKHDLENQERVSGRGSNPDPSVLLPFKVLVHPLEQRFTYHFTGNKPTNRLDKPEYFLKHVTGLIGDYFDFLQTNVQPVLFRCFQGSDLVFAPAYIDATSAFITSLLPIVKDKLDNIASQVINHPPLLGHLVQEVVQFDESIHESYAYTPSSPSVMWYGLTHYLLETRGYFQTWLLAERDHAMSRYHAIVESSDAGELDYDAVSAETTKPSKATIRLSGLLETITERYKNLPDPDLKSRFLVEIQIEILDHYFNRLHHRLEGYKASTTLIGRSLQGISREKQAEILSVKGLDLICRILGSADYLEDTLRDWSNDVFFLELWTELDSRSKQPSLTVGAEKIGVSVRARFEEMISGFHRVRTRSEEALLDKLKGDVRLTLRAYAGITTWAFLSPSAVGESVSSGLEPTLFLLAEYFSFLHKALGKALVRRIGRKICLSIQSFVWDHVLFSRSSFSTGGAVQLITDMRAICSTLDRHLGAGQAQVGMRRLLEGVTLLGLPLKGKVQELQPGNSGDGKDDDTAWATEQDGEVQGEELGDDDELGLFQAQRLVFKDDESARFVIGQLGLGVLTEADARAILKKRLETQS